MLIPVRLLVLPSEMAQLVRQLTPLWTMGPSVGLLVLLPAVVMLVRQRVLHSAVGLLARQLVLLVLLSAMVMLVRRLALHSAVVLLARQLVPLSAALSLLPVLLLVPLTVMRSLPAWWQRAWRVRQWPRRRRQRGRRK